jgi:hypothetical protein
MAAKKNTARKLVGRKTPLTALEKRLQLAETDIAQLYRFVAQLQDHNAVLRNQVHALLIKVSLPVDVRPSGAPPLMMAGPVQIVRKGPGGKVIKVQSGKDGMVLVDGTPHLKDCAFVPGSATPGLIRVCTCGSTGPRAAANPNAN